MWPGLPYSKQVKLEKVESFFLKLFLCWKDLLLELLFFKNFLNFLTINVRFSLLEPFALSSLLDGLEDFNAKHLFLFSLSSFSAILVLSISYSLNFPNTLTYVIEVRYLDSKIAMTFGCHVLLRDFSIFTFNYSSSNTFPMPLWWFTMWVNLFEHLHLFLLVASGMFHTLEWKNSSLLF